MSTQWDIKEQEQPVTWPDQLPILDKQQALSLLRKAVDEKGHNYVDPNADTKSTCEYFSADGAPACIVGHVLSYFGITSNDVWGNQTTEVIELAAELRRNGCLYMSPEALGMLDIAQKLQDVGNSWGEVLNRVAQEAAHGECVAYEFTDEDV